MKGAHLARCATAHYAALIIQVCVISAEPCSSPWWQLAPAPILYADFRPECNAIETGAHQLHEHPLKVDVLTADPASMFLELTARPRLRATAPERAAELRQLVLDPRTLVTMVLIAFALHERDHGGRANRRIVHARRCQPERPSPPLLRLADDEQADKLLQRLPHQWGGKGVDATGDVEVVCLRLRVNGGPARPNADVAGRSKQEQAARIRSRAEELLQHGQSRASLTCI